jgi:hypothetical protein
MSDKRQVATDALETLGTVIGDGEKRDAIHLAVEPVVAAEKLFPGQDVGLIAGRASASAAVKLGIVDPFLKHPVIEGQRFWLVVYPRQITSLRHVWSHPAFEDEAVDAKPTSKEASEAWLREWIKDADCPSYEVVMDALQRGFKGGYVQLANDDDDMSFCWEDEYLHFNGRDAHEEIPPEFWNHVEMVLGVTIPKDRRAESFSCSC